MAKFTIDLSAKTEAYIRQQFERDKKLWKECKVANGINNFEQYLVWFIEDYIAEIED